MYEKILNSIIEDMAKFALVSTVIISSDYYDTITNKQKHHIEGFLGEGINWVILSDQEECFYFKYSWEPMEIER